MLQPLLRLAGISAQVEQAPALLRPTDMVHVQGDPALARRLLDWAPKVAWEETLACVPADWRVRVHQE